ncbi:MAG: TRAP transporter small permease [Bacillota bacterium]|nr:TRAP transporter small permease [Bacillota bacterium]
MKRKMLIGALWRSGEHYEPTSCWHDDLMQVLIQVLYIHLKFSMRKVAQKTMNKFVSTFSMMASWLAKLSGILLLLMCLLVCVHVIMRGFFNTGILGTYELVQYGMLVIVSLTLAENELTGGNIIVNFLLDKMKPRISSILSISMYIITILFMSFVLYNQVNMVGKKFADGSVTGTLAIPHWILVLLICIGLFFFIIAFIIRIYSMLSDYKKLKDQEAYS